MQSDPKIDLAIAGSAIVLNLIEVLIAKDVLTKDEALSLLGTAQKQCVSTGTTGAARVVGALYDKVRGK